MNIYYADPADELLAVPYVLVEPATRAADPNAVFYAGDVGGHWTQAVYEWDRYTHTLAKSVIERELSVSAALKRVRQRTGWPMRKTGEAIGVTHTQVRRIELGQQTPGREVSRRVFDLELLTRYLGQFIPNDVRRLRAALETIPAGQEHSAVDVIYRMHDIGQATLLATTDLFPRAEWADVPPDRFRSGATVEID